MMNNEYKAIPKEKFAFVAQGEKIHDKKLETKPIGYFKDAFIRFRKNKSSVVAFCIIVFLVLFAIFVPFFTNYTIADKDGYYATVLPKSNLFSKIGIWDGTSWRNDTQGGYDYYTSIGVESGKKVVTKEDDSFYAEDGTIRYRFKTDSYLSVGYVYVNLSNKELADLVKYQSDNDVQIMYPMPRNFNKKFNMGNNGANFWYKLAVDVEGVTDTQLSETTGLAVRDANGNLIPDYLTENNKGNTTTIAYSGKRISGDDGSYVYAVRVQGGAKVRVNYYDYYTYLNGHEPSFLFGTNGYGQDILTCLASGARLSFILAICVSVINLTIGAIYGAIEGYYGGAIDITMERISDILASVPFIVVASLFKLHLAEKVGVLPTLLFAFVMTGWVGMAARVRMQFYRFKGQEYVLAARTLGARDSRLMFKHIFPNSLGTIITGAILSIPGVIFSESMLSYLGIINLETSGSLTSIGTMLSQGEGYLSSFPHVILFPALFISLLEISFNLFGNGLRDAFNPSLRGTEE